MPKIMGSQKIPNDPVENWFIQSRIKGGKFPKELMEEIKYI